MLRNSLILFNERFSETNLTEAVSNPNRENTLININTVCDRANIPIASLP